MIFDDNSDVLTTNKAAIATAERTYGPLEKASERFTPGEISSYLNTLGFACTECRLGRISYPVMQFFHFQPRVLCMNCQNKVKERAF